MKSVVMMHLYYDKENDIKAISPLKEQQFEDQGCKCINVPLDEVEDFLTAKKNPYNYYIEHRRRDGIDTYRIAAKVVNITYIRSIDNYLTQVVYQNKEINAIRIENNTKEKKLHFYMSEGLKNQIDGVGFSDDEDEFERLSAFKSLVQLGFYFTTKDDPSFLIKSIYVKPAELLREKCVVVKYEEDLRNLSLYTKKLFAYYSYREKKDI